MSDSASGEYEERASLGCFIWVCLKHDSWWPAQVVLDSDYSNPRPRSCDLKSPVALIAFVHRVVDESCVSERVRPRRGSKPYGKVLLRLCFLYADPAKCRSEFESVVERENLSCRDMFLKSLEKDLASAKSARSKERASTAKAKALTAASTPDSIPNRLKRESQSVAEKARPEIS